MHRNFSLGICIVSIVTPMLASCGNFDWGSKDPTSLPGAGEISTRMAGGSSRIDCAQVAAWREHDVMEQGFDDDIRSTVHDKVFADCIAWRQRSGD